MTSSCARCRLASAVEHRQLYDASGAAWNDAGAQLRARSEDSMVAQQMRAGPRHQGHEPGDQIMGGEDHRGDAVSPRPREPETHSTVIGPLEAIVRQRRVEQIATQTFETGTVAGRHPACGMEIEPAGVLASVMVVHPVREVRGQREQVGHDRGERQARLLAEQSDPSDRCLGAIEQERLLGQHRRAVECHGVGIIFPVHAEGTQLALRPCVHALCDLLQVVSRGGPAGP